MDSANRYFSLIDALVGRRVAVIGDVMADEFVYGQVARVSREAPVLILEHSSSEIVPGGAGNAANNVAALGGEARLAALVGRDEAGRHLLKRLHARIKRANILRLSDYTTPIKTRILAGGIHSAKQQVVRIDRGGKQVFDIKTRKAFERMAVRAVDRCDAVLVSDYGSGLITPALVSRLKMKARKSRRQVPILLDTRYGLLRYKGLTACAPNEAEVENTLGIKIEDNKRVLEKAGKELLARTRMSAVLVTRGSRGMALFQQNRPVITIPIFGSDEIADVTGAGDTVIATVTLALAAGANFEQAARLANYAAGLVVMKRGTSTVDVAELRRALSLDN